tara:strand:- start:178 stop:1467 length:1290 start_codon:yes stop_codon:yes gene_type:complete
MKLSQYFLKPRKDTPSDATLISHKLMIKSSMIKQTTSGIYTWLPLGLKVLQKIEDIVRTVHNRYGCQELLMPTIQSSNIWKKSGRYDDYGPEMLKFYDRNKKELLYGPTNEELITEVFKEYINSYKDLPKNLYQIQWKFRDEIRPRFGVMRCREFLMKDNYSFDLTKKDAEKSYDNMFKCYLDIFERIGIKVLPVMADPGAIGGDLSHEFHLISESGDTNILYDKKVVDINKIDYSNSFQFLRNLYSVTEDEYKKKKDIEESKLIKTTGIEVGHIFYFGTKYSEKLGASVLDNKGKKVNVEMGSYGIGISRIVAAIIESSHDEKGIIWPKSISPFDVGLINLNNKNNKLTKISDQIYNYLIKNKVDVLYDETNERPGEKFANMDLIGVPSQIILGENSLKENDVEIKNRKTKKIVKIKIKNINEILKKI